MFRRRRSRERERDSHFQSVLTSTSPNAASSSAITYEAVPSDTFGTTLSDMLGDACHYDPSLKRLLNLRGGAPYGSEDAEVPDQALEHHEARHRASKRRAGTPPLGDRKVHTPPPECLEDDVPAGSRGPTSLRRTDVREYGTLDSLLSPSWQPEVETSRAPQHGRLPDLASPRIAGSQSQTVKRPSTTGVGRRGSQSSSRGDRSSQNSSAGFGGLTDFGQLNRSGSKESHASSARSGLFRAGSKEVAKRRHSRKNTAEHAAYLERKLSSGSRKSADGSHHHHRHHHHHHHHKRHSKERKSQLSGGDVSIEAAPGLEPKEKRPSKDHGEKGLSRDHAEKRQSKQSEQTMTERSGSSSSFSSGTESKISSPSTDLPTREMLGEIKKDGVSQDWSLLLSFAKEQKEELEKNQVSGHHIRFMLDDEPAAYTPAAPAIRRGSWSLNSSKKRPPSPLRPGVFVGHDPSGRQKVFASHQLPLGLPQSATRTYDTGNFPTINTPSRPVTSDAVAKARQPVGDGSGVSMWEKMLSMYEDQSKTEDARAYDAWRKKVLDCTRNMRLEVSRFKVDEKL